MNPAALDDSTLLSRLRSLVQQEREDIAEIIAHLAEVDNRGLAIDLAFPSLFAYCVRELGYTEAAAYYRIRAARAARLFPEIVDMLRKGDLSLEAVVRLHPRLDSPEAASLLDAAKGKTVRQVESLVAGFSPAPDKPDFARVISTRPQVPGPCRADPGTLFSPTPSLPGTGDEDPVAPEPGRIPVSGPIIAPDSGSDEGAAAEAGSAAEAVLDTPSDADPDAGMVKRVHFSFTADEEILILLRRAQEILRHKYPAGRFEQIFRDALIALLEKRDPDRRLLGKLPKGVTSTAPGRNRKVRPRLRIDARCMRGRAHGPEQIGR
ncbi:MAG: hypothetical protein WC728_18410 [Elusimicrobiota bacterium]